MAKITLTIEEKIEQTEGRIIIGFEVSQTIDYGAEGEHGASLLSVIGAIVPKMTMDMIHILQKHTGGRMHKFGFAEKTASLEEMLDQLKQQIEAEDFDTKSTLTH